jgi:hypothetical protein
MTSADSNLQPNHAADSGLEFPDHPRFEFRIRLLLGKGLANCGANLSKLSRKAGAVAAHRQVRFDREPR